MKIDRTDQSSTARWYRFGVVVAMVHLAFLVVLIWLLRTDVVLGLAFAIVGGILGGVAIMLYVLYWRR